jgi:hypothetical protein
MIMELAQGPNAMIGQPEFRYHQNLDKSWSADLIVEYYDNHGVLQTIAMTCQGQKKVAAKLECCKFVYDKLSDLMYKRKGAIKIVPWKEGKAAAADNATTAENGKSTEMASLSKETTVEEEPALDSSSSTSADCKQPPTDQPSPASNAPTAPLLAATPGPEPYVFQQTPKQRQLYREGVRHTRRLFETATWMTNSSSSSSSSSYISSFPTLNELGTQLQALKIKTPSPSPKGRVYISFDLEATTHHTWRGYGNGTPTQLGITIFRGSPSSLRALTSDTPSKSLANGDSIQCLHYQFAELVGYRSRIAKLNKSGPFLYGKTQTVPMADMNEICQRIVAWESQYGEITLVGHAVKNDIKYLQQAGVYAFCPFFEGIIDTQQVFLDEAVQPKKLERCVEEYGESMAGMHNAGNDAVWTMWVAMKRVEEGKGEVLLRYEEEERRIAEERKRREEERKVREKELEEKYGKDPWTGGWGESSGWDTTPTSGFEW